MTTLTGRSTFHDLYMPKLVTVLQARYGLAALKADAVAGLTVAIVALPLSMALAIASGVTPDRGLYAAIVGGFFISALGGSQFQIGGPAGAFIVLVAATVMRFGVEGMLLAVILSGVILVLIGLLRLGTFINYIPHPVTVAFTAGIAVIIFSSQIRDLLGLQITGHEPGAIIAKLDVLYRALPTFNPAAFAIAGFTIVTVFVVRAIRPKWPALLIAVTLGAVVAIVLRLPVETIGTRFGGIPSTLPLPHLPAVSLDRLIEILPAAGAFALLGGIESLLSAVVADTMSGDRHRSNCELVAQGVANIATGLFGGICVTGTIARTATNVRAGAHGPMAGILHSVFLLLFMLMAAPLASYIPLAALAGLLAAVTWNMADKQAFAGLLRASRGDAVVVLVTFLLVVFRDLTEGILAGFVMASLLFIHRMASNTDVTSSRQALPRMAAASGTPPSVQIFRFEGALFFGAAVSVASDLEVSHDNSKAYVLDLSATTILDSSAAAVIEGFVRKAARRGGEVYIAGARDEISRVLVRNGVDSRAVRFTGTSAEAVKQAGGTPAAASHGSERVLAAR